nr:39S ribosomal protein L45, mitochondrial [Ipomoea batatas]GMD45305.1 39S ribosomal protein L45, mitochondrial [Ipomoea batatas]
MALRRLTSVQNLQRCLYRATEIRSVSSSLLNSSSRNSPDIFCVTHVSSWSTISRLYNDTSSLPWTSGAPVLRSTIEPKPTNFGYQRSVTVQAKAPPQARQMVC